MVTENLQKAVEQQRSKDTKAEFPVPSFLFVPLLLCCSTSSLSMQGCEQVVHFLVNFKGVADGLGNLGAQ